MISRATCYWLLALVPAIALNSYAREYSVELLSQHILPKIADECAQRTASNYSDDLRTQGSQLRGLRSFSPSELKQRSRKACLCVSDVYRANLHAFQAENSDELQAKFYTWRSGVHRDVETKLLIEKCFESNLPGSQLPSQKANNLASPAVQETQAIKTWKASSLLFPSRGAGVHWFLVRDAQDKWAFRETGNTFEENTEEIMVNWRTRTVFLAVAPSTSSKTNYLCSYGLGTAISEKSSNDRKTVGLTACNSFFTKSTIQAADVMTGVWQALLATRITQMAVDTEKLLKAAQDSGLLAEIERKEMETYRSAYARARTAADFADFAKKYADDDPEGLVLQAREKFAAVDLDESVEYCNTYVKLAKTSSEFQEVINRCSKYPETQAAMELAKVGKISALKSENEAAEQRRSEEAKWQAEQREAKEGQLRAWRNQIKVGDESFCGPVIQVRSPMVQIALSHPLPGYASEIWMRVDGVYPKNMAWCENVNNQIRAKVY